MAAIPTVTYGSTEIEYTVKRSRQRTTAEVAIDPKEGVVVTCPSDLPETRIQNLVMKRGSWILRKMKHLEEVAAEPPQREYVSGETYYYLGRGYRLKVIEDPDVHAYDVKLKEGRFFVWIPPITAEEPRELRVPEALRWWFIKKAEARLLERVELYIPKVGSEPRGVMIKNQMKRWGSCTKDGLVNLNYRIIMAPMSVVDYVVVHELIHLTVDNHSSEFWDRLRIVLPDFERRKEWLRINGPALII